MDNKRKSKNYSKYTFKETIRNWIEIFLGPPSAIIPAIIIGVITNIISTLILGFSETGYAVINIIWPIFILIFVLGLGILLIRYKVGFPSRTFFLFLIIGSVFLMSFICIKSFVHVPQLLLLPSSVAAEKLYDSNLDFEIIDRNGYVVKQKPKVGKLMLKGKKVDLKIDKFNFLIKTLNDQFVIKQIARIKGISYPFWLIPGAKLYFLVKDSAKFVTNYKITGPFQTTSDTEWEVTVQVGELDDTGKEFDITAMLSLCNFGKNHLYNEDISLIDPCGNRKFSNTIHIRRK